MDPRRGMPPEQDTEFTLSVFAILLIGTVLLGLLEVL
jgi:hypothetical protein